MKQFSVVFITVILLLGGNRQDVYAQKYLIEFDSLFSYPAASNAEPASDWYTPEFDDSGWPVDTHSIGFGEPVYVQVPVTTRSLYLRYRFHLNNAVGIRGINFSGDFDDGYVAYINGKEVARKNAPDMPFPPYDTLATRSHEFEGHTAYPVFGVYLDSLLLDSVLVTGENVVAVHVLNDSINGSDLYFDLRMYTIPLGKYSLYSRVFRYKRFYAIDSVNFPLVIIETDEFGIPYKNQRRRAFMGIIDNGPGSYNTPFDSCNVYYGDVDIEVRGQSSSEFPKRSYRFELKDEFEGDSNVVILGMPSDDDWILFGPFQDKAQFRNKMMFDLGRQFGRYQPRSEFCEVILNGEYIGLYAISETIKRHPDRVNIARLRTAEISGIDVTGGYILKYDKPNGFQIDYPKPDDIQPEQEEYIMGYMDDFNSMIYTDDFWDPEIGFRRYVNDTSLVDHMIMTEFCKNGDGYYISTYFYKDRADRDDRLTYGPLWDHDLVFGNTYFQEGNLTENWQFEFPSNARYIKIKRFLQDQAFARLFIDRWKMARESFLSDDNIFNYMDSMATSLADPVARNYEVWPVWGENLFNSNYISTSYENELYNMKNWISGRVSWIDDHVDELDGKYDSVFYPDYVQEIGEGEFGFDVFPNPFSQNLKVAFVSNSRMPVTVRIVSLTGQLVLQEEFVLEPGYNTMTLEPDQISAMMPGLYIMNLSSRGRFIAYKKIVRQ